MHLLLHFALTLSKLFLTYLCSALCRYLSGMKSMSHMLVILSPVQNTDTMRDFLHCCGEKDNDNE